MNKFGITVCACALLAIFGLAPARVLAQSTNEPYTFITLAGMPGKFGSTDGAGSAARFGTRDSGPWGLALDSAGNLYTADYWNYTIRKITPDGVVSTLAGQAQVPGSTDGPASEARFFEPADVAVDTADNLYVADSGNNAIRVGTIFSLPAIRLGLPQRLPNGQFQMTLAASANQTYAIEVSTNLSNWLEWTNVTPATSSVLITDPKASNSGTRFYRALHR
jgi:DNA-binding beta-propeller fold protein YncE